MATTVTIACPECHKQLKAPPEILGKKIRCKSCGHVFAARASAEPPAKGAAKPDPKAAVKPKSGKKHRPEDEDEESNPYAVTDLSLTPRCPNCANEMEEGDKICLICGYNTQTRIQAATKKIHDTTGADYFLWLLPGITCAVLTLLLIGYPAFHYWAMPSMIWDNWDKVLEENEGNQSKTVGSDKITGASAYLFHPGIAVWVAVACWAIAYRCGKFAVKRLVFNPHPPEIERKK
jgi:hypothetical protein